MKPFLTTRRKLIELGLLPGFVVALYFVSNLETAFLFSLGYVWNWTASQDMSMFFEGRKYRFSLLKMVFNLQHLFLIPFRKFHPLVQIPAKILPAGLFWVLVIIFADSKMPWWATFVGSFVFELTQLDGLLIKKTSENS